MLHDHHTQLERLLAQLQSDHMNQRREAAIALSQIRDPRVVEALMIALHDDDATVRANAASGLGHNAASQASDALIQCLRDDDDLVRERAATALAQIGDARAIPALIDAIDDSGTWARNRMIYVLGASRARAAVEPLIVQLDHEDPSTQGVAAWALGVIGDSRALDPLLAMLQRDDASVRSNAAYALGELGAIQSIPTLIALLDDPSPEVRAKTAWSLGNLGEESGDTRMVTPLLALLEDYTALKDQSAHVFVCQYAAEALTQIGTEEALMAVDAWKPQAREQLLPYRVADAIRALQHRDLQTRQAAIQQLLTIGDVTVPSLINALKQHDSLRVRQGAAQALGEFGAWQAVNALIAALADADIGLWSQATAALAKIGIAAPLYALLEDDKQAVKLGAAIALWRIERAEAAFSLLLQAIQHEDVVVRGSAITSLWSQPDERAVATLQIQLQEEVIGGMMAKYILRALECIGGAMAVATVANYLATHRDRI